MAAARQNSRVSRRDIARSMIPTAGPNAAKLAVTFPGATYHKGNRRHLSL